MKLFEALRRRWVVWVWNHTPTCAEMARQASRSFEQPPSLVLRLKMRLHHLICVWCLRYEQQLKFLHHAAPQLSQQLDSVANRTLSTDAKERMKARLQEVNDRRL